MKTDWLKHPDQDYWTAQLNRLSLGAARTMFGDYTYTVSDRQQILRSGNVADLETAKAETERLVLELGR